MKINNHISICITTFKEREKLAQQLISDIRQRVPEEVDIILAVNGNNNEIMPDSYRKSMLETSLQYKNVYPFICPEFKSLCKLWNTLVIFSRTDYNMILCDDVAFKNPEIYQKVINYINETENEFFTINGGFSHFICTKKILHKLNYFDERLSAFGEEDGDMHYKHISILGKKIPSLEISGIYNTAAYHLSSKKLETHVYNKPRFNREVVNLMYKPDPDGIINPMDPTQTPVKRVIDDPQQYPHEMFVINNKHNIEKFDKVIF